MVVENVNGNRNDRSDSPKYAVLPPELGKYRLAIERMLIRDLAALLDNKQGIKTISISDYSLANRKIGI